MPGRREEPALGFLFLSQALPCSCGEHSCWVCGIRVWPGTKSATTETAAFSRRSLWRYVGKCSPSWTSKVTEWQLRFGLGFAGWERQEPPLSQRPSSVCGCREGPETSRVGTTEAAQKAVCPGDFSLRGWLRSFSPGRCLMKLVNQDGTISLSRSQKTCVPFPHH